MKAYAIAFVLATVLGCSHSSDREPTLAASSEEALGFGVYWPPQDPQAPEGPAGEMLLLGQLRIRESTSPQGDATQTAWIELIRGEDEEHREMWNSRLAYREFGWMKQVRVWDLDRKWLWPNLPYLLRVHGKARIERYGGIDPAKGVDNDFAAVLIRAYDAKGEVEKAVTNPAPLVSAEWYAIGLEDVDRQTIVHAARSDEFILPMHGNPGMRQGRLGIWLIYADFMGAPTPSSWPKKLEWRGGILAYFEIDWTIDPNDKHQLLINQKTPPSDTGFDWATWVGPPDADERKRATSRLSAPSDILDEVEAVRSQPDAHTPAKLKAATVPEDTPTAELRSVE